MPTSQLVNPSTFLTPLTVTLQDVLTSRFYLVPDYQRDFSWTEEEVGALWEDLKTTASNAITTAGEFVANPRPHFMGAIVLHDVDPPHRLQVMDGQQRLVTLTALCSILIEFVRAHCDNEIGDRWERSLQQMVAVSIGGEQVARLELARDQEHYRALFCERWNKNDRDQYLSGRSIPKR